jgi:hypothetical protein
LTPVAVVEQPFQPAVDELVEPDVVGDHAGRADGIPTQQIERDREVDGGFVRERKPKIDLLRHRAPMSTCARSPHCATLTNVPRPQHRDALIEREGSRRWCRNEIHAVPGVTDRRDHVVGTRIQNCRGAARRDLHDGLLKAPTRS